MVALVATLFLQVDGKPLFVGSLSSPKSFNVLLLVVAGVVGTAIGWVSARRVQMTAMPQMVALFNGLGGGAVALVALLEYRRFLGGPVDTVAVVTSVLSLVIGSLSFTGSLVAFAKLQELMPGRPLTFAGQKALNSTLMLVALVIGISLMVTAPNMPLFWGLFCISLVLGVTLVLPIGGADMPVVISLLNSFTGCAAGLAGFVLGNSALLIGGGLVGASGLILTLQMCVAMNRPLSNVLFGAFGATNQTAIASKTEGSVRSYSAEDVAILFSTADSVMVVPGYGMAVAQAQHAVKDLCLKLNGREVKVCYAIHPVAGRMPGHMNVLLAEADVPYEQLLDIDEANPMFPQTDVVLVIGANDVVNPSARTDKTSPIYGMPILDVDRAKTVVVCKRGMGTGFAGIDNELFLAPNCVMLFGDAKQSITKLSAALDAV